MVGMEQETNKMCSESDLTGLKHPSGNIGPLWAVMAVTGSGLDLSSGIGNVSIYS